MPFAHIENFLLKNIYAYICFCFRFLFVASCTPYHLSGTDFTQNGTHTRRQFITHQNRAFFIAHPPATWRRSHVCVCVSVEATHSKLHASCMLTHVFINFLFVFRNNFCFSHTLTRSDFGARITLGWNVQVYR